MNFEKVTQNSRIREKNRSLPEVIILWKCALIWIVNILYLPNG